MLVILDDEDPIHVRRKKKKSLFRKIMTWLVVIIAAIELALWSYYGRNL